MHVEPLGWLLMWLRTVSSFLRSGPKPSLSMVSISSITTCVICRPGNQDRVILLERSPSFSHPNQTALPGYLYRSQADSISMVLQWLTCEKKRCPFS